MGGPWRWPATAGIPCIRSGSCGTMTRPLDARPGRPRKPWWTKGGVRRSGRRPWCVGWWADGSIFAGADFSDYIRDSRVRRPSPFTIGADSRHSPKSDKSQLARCDYLRAARRTAHPRGLGDRLLDAGVYAAGKVTGSVTPARATGRSDRQPRLRTYGGTQHPGRTVHRMDFGNGFATIERRRVLNF